MKFNLVDFLTLKSPLNCEIKAKNGILKIIVKNHLFNCLCRPTMWCCYRFESLSKAQCIKPKRKFNSVICTSAHYSPLLATVTAVIALQVFYLLSLLKEHDQEFFTPLTHLTTALVKLYPPVLIYLVSSNNEIKLISLHLLSINPAGMFSFWFLDWNFRTYHKPFSS